MSMSTGIVGVKPPDDRWKKMKAIWDSCEAADIEPPAEVSNFFGWEDPDNAGVIVYRKELGEACQEYKDDCSSGYEVHLDKLPKDVKILRFTNSW